MPNQPNTIDFLRAETFSIPTCANSNCMSHSMCEVETVKTHISILIDMNWRRIRILIVIICTYGMLMEYKLIVHIIFPTRIQWTMRQKRDLSKKAESIAGIQFKNLYILIVNLPILA